MASKNVVIESGERARPCCQGMLLCSSGRLRSTLVSVGTCSFVKRGRTFPDRPFTEPIEHTQSDCAILYSFANSIAAAEPGPQDVSTDTSIAHRQRGKVCGGALASAGALLLFCENSLRCSSQAWRRNKTMREARFIGTIERIEEGWRASFRLRVPNDVFSQPGDTEVFATELQATKWLHSKAATRGFSSIEIERRSVRD